MKEIEIENLITVNDKDKLSFYLSNILSKSKDIESENISIGNNNVNLNSAFLLN